MTSLQRGPRPTPHHRPNHPRSPRPRGPPFNTRHGPRHPHPGAPGFAATGENGNPVHVASPFPRSPSQSPLFGNSDGTSSFNPGLLTDSSKSDVLAQNSVIIICWPIPYWLIHSANPQSRPGVITIFTCGICIPTFQNIPKQNKFQVII